MRAVLIDDEEIAIHLLERSLQTFEDIEVMGTYTCPAEAEREIDKLNVDVVFLDMEMPGIHGLEFAEKLMTNNPFIEIVFVTAHDEFSLQAFDVNAVDYILKPIDMERLERAIWKVRTIKKGFLHSHDEPDKSYVHVMGNIYLTDQSGEMVKWRTRKVKELFIYLFHHQEKPVQKFKLIEDLWPDKNVEQAFTILHTTTYQLRRTLKEAHISFKLELFNDSYILRHDLNSDYATLISLLNQTRITDEHISRINELYEGDYLDVEAYPWAYAQQIEMKELYLRYLQNFVAWANDSHHFSQTVKDCLDILGEMDSFGEKTMYLILDYYGRTENLSKLTSFYQQFELWRKDELHIPIPREITHLYNHYLP